MRIACLQFAPQVGDINNNLNRADAVLNKASAEDLESLDLLVLPEMAFSGAPSTARGLLLPSQPLAARLTVLRVQFQVSARNFPVPGAVGIWH